MTSDLLKEINTLSNKKILLSDDVSTRVAKYIQEGTVSKVIEENGQLAIKFKNGTSLTVKREMLDSKALGVVDDFIKRVDNTVLWKKYTKMTEIKFNSIDEQVKFLVENVPGLTKEQANKLLNFAFERDSSVTLGGSRIRGNYTELSDLDAGFSNVSNGQYKRLIDGLNKMEGVKFEDGIKLIVGNETPNVPKIENMEEFFQRTGTRLRPDSSGSYVLNSSGSITITKDGTIKLIPPGGFK